MHLYLVENLKTHAVQIAYNGVDVTDQLSSIVPEISNAEDAQRFINHLYHTGAISVDDTAEDVFLPTYAVKITVGYNQDDLVCNSSLDIVERDLGIISESLAVIDKTIADEFIDTVTSNLYSTFTPTVFYPAHMNSCSLEVLDFNLKQCSSMLKPVKESNLFTVKVGYTLSGEAKRRLEYFVGGILVDN